MKATTRRTCLRTLAGGLAAIRAQAAPAKRPNVLVIVSDDQGYGDISSYEHPPEVRTPHMDRIAKRGVRFVQGYANAYVCAPSRAALLTVHIRSVTVSTQRPIHEWACRSANPPWPTC